MSSNIYQASSLLLEYRSECTKREKFILRINGAPSGRKYTAIGALTVLEQLKNAVKKGKYNGKIRITDAAIDELRKRQKFSCLEKSCIN
jgi:DNA integrity scanning protein DisA with diadenylate cyclase activity